MSPIHGGILRVSCGKSEQSSLLFPGFRQGAETLQLFGGEFDRLMTAPIELYFTLLLIYFVVNRGLSAMTGSLENIRRFNRLFIRI